MEIVTFETPDIGDRSYLVTDGQEAVVVDPQRDIGRILDAAGERGVRIAWVLETHIHNDYLSGGLALARRCGATYGVSGDEAVAFERHPLADGELLLAGRLEVMVVATPGHTAHHLSYVVRHREADGTETMAVFSGGCLLYGTAGRTDLSGEGNTERLARAQWDSIRQLSASLPADASVHPTHGFGSFCAATGTTPADGSTIGRERAINPALFLSQSAFAEDLQARLVVYPRYYVHMAPRNRAGVGELAPPPVAWLDPGELRGRTARGEWIVDIRPRRAFAAGHTEGTVNVELGPQLATYLGWVFPWGSPLSLLADTSDQLEAAQLALGRIGLDGLAGWGTATTDSLIRLGNPHSYPVSGFAGLHTAQRRGQRLLVLDVRHPHEWAAGHLPGAVHIPVQDLPGALTSLPHDRAIWVHCAAGYRAALASSLLDRAGFDVTLVDDRWDLAMAVA